MGADTLAEGGGSKPNIKAENILAINNGRRGNNNSHRRDDYAKKEKFMGADPNLQGFVFEARRSRVEQVANFEKVDTRIKTQIGMECHLLVLESIEKGKKIMPDEPDPVLKDDGTMTRAEEMKFKEKFSRYLNQVEKIETQLKQC